MAINTTTFESTLQTKLDDTTLAAKDMLLLGKALEATTGNIAASDVTTAGATQVTAVNDAGTAKVSEVNALATNTFKTVGGASILGTGDIATLPSQTGASGKVLKSDGTNATWGTDGGLPAGGTVGQLVTNTASGVGTWGDAPSGGLVSVQKFAVNNTTSSLNTTWTKPAGITKVRVQLVGSGAHGSNSGWGGGAGGYSEKIIDVSAVSSVAVTVGGAPGSSSGKVSSFGTYLSATGGSQYGAGVAGMGGEGSGGDINIVGGGGDYHDTGASGAGGSSYFGGGMPGSSSGNTSTTYAAVAYGAGGCGVYNGYTQGSQDKVGGLVIVWEYA